MSLNVGLLGGLLAVAACVSARGAAHPAHPADARHTTARMQAPRRPAPSGHLGERALVSAALVRLSDVSDLSPRWRVRPTFPSEVQCPTHPFRGARQRVSSHRFMLDNVSFEETVARFRGLDASRRALMRLDSRESLACLSRTARERTAEQAGGPASVPELSRSEQLGGNGEVLRYTSTAESQIGMLRGVIDAVHLRVGRGVGALLIVSGPDVITDELYERVVAVFERRLRAAFG